QDDRAMEEATRAWGREQGADRDRSGRLAEDRDVAGIAAKGLDVRVHPFECGDIVEDAEIGTNVRMSQEAEGAKPIVEGDHDHAAPRQRGAVIPIFGSRAAKIAATMDPDHDRTPCLWLQHSAPDIEV